MSAGPGIAGFARAPMPPPIPAIPGSKVWQWKIPEILKKFRKIQENLVSGEVRTRFEPGFWGSSNQVRTFWTQPWSTLINLDQPWSTPPPRGVVWQWKILEIPEILKNLKIPAHERRPWNCRFCACPHATPNSCNPRELTMKNSGNSEKFIKFQKIWKNPKKF